MRRWLIFGLGWLALVAGPEAQAPADAANAVRRRAADPRRRERAPIERWRVRRGERALYRGVGPRSAVKAACRRFARVDHPRQDDDAGDDQRARAHGLRGLCHAGARDNHTARTSLDHVQREAFYGVAAATSVGSSPDRKALQFQRDQQAGKFPPAARYLFMPGMAPPDGGPDRMLRVATNKLVSSTRCRRRPRRARALRRMADAEDRSREDVGRRSRRHVSQAAARDLHRHRRRGAQAQDHRARARDPAGGPEGRVRAGADVLVHMVQRRRWTRNTSRCCVRGNRTGRR